MLREWYTTAP